MALRRAEEADLGMESKGLGKKHLAEAIQSPSLADGTGRKQWRREGATWYAKVRERRGGRRAARYPSNNWSRSCRERKGCRQMTAEERQRKLLTSKGSLLRSEGREGGGLRRSRGWEEATTMGRFEKKSLTEVAAVQLQGVQ